MRKILLSLSLGFIFIVSSSIYSRPQNKEPTRQPDQKPKETVRLTSDLVMIPVVVMDKNGRLFTHLEAKNFFLFEDGKKQNIAYFDTVGGPMTIVLVLEFSRILELRTGYDEWLIYEVYRPAVSLVRDYVQEKDYIAIVAYDIRPKVLVDFTNQKGKMIGAINILLRNRPAFSESNLFDALKFVLEGGSLDGKEYGGLRDVKGRTAVILVSTGIDTFSRINYGQMRKVIQRLRVPIYSIRIGDLFYKKYEQYLSGPSRLTFLQAENTLRTFAKESGGRSYAVTFAGAVSSVMQSVTTMIRYHYVIGYHPVHQKKKGKKKKEHKIKIRVDVDNDGKIDKKVTVQHRTIYRESRWKEKE